MHIPNDKWLITSTRIFYKNSSSSLDCISISALCSPINSTVATVYVNFTITALNWNNKIWQDAACEIHCTKQTENMKYICDYVVNSVHEHFAETDSHLHTSQHQASLKHENFTVSYHSHTTLPPQNILQLQLHLSCTLYSINNLRFTKIRVSWNGELPFHVPNF